MNDFFYKAIIFIIEIKHSFKEKRESLLRNLLQNIKEKFHNSKSSIHALFCNRNFLLASLIFIIFGAFFLRFNFNIGPLTILNLDQANIFFHHNHNYFSIPPIIFGINYAILTIAKIVKISNAILLQAILLFLAIISTALSCLALKKSKIYSNKLNYNIITLSIAIATLIPINLGNVNECNITYNYIIIIALPYISYLFVKKLNYLDNLIIAICAIILICLDYHYIALIILCELLRSSNIRNIFNVRNILILILCLINYSYFYKQYNYQPKLPDFELLSLPIIFLASNYTIIKRNFILINLSKASLVMALIYLISGQDHNLATYYCLNLALFILIFYYFVKIYSNNFYKLWFILITIAIFSLYTPYDTSKLVASLASLWWIGSIIISLKLNKKISKISKKFNLIQKIILPTNINDFLLLFITILIIYFLSIITSSIVIWLINIIFSIILIHNYRIFFKKSYKFVAIISFILIFVIFGLIKESISYNKNIRYTSNNEIYQQISNNIRNVTNNITLINFDPQISYPLANDLKNINRINLDQNQILYKNIALNKIDHKLLNNLIKKISNPKNEKLLIQNYIDHQYSFCNIGFIEFYLRDDNFKKIFSNYKFENKILLYQNFSEDISLKKRYIENNKINNIIITDIDVYSRKK